ncbi:MAG: hypothetical protein Athens071416_338 [Parcubacteria group bacterium Athens0714_16]|nr:MAG: hypothetical protein Athens071416_338 [Parcubacteria group bacterium Athens0714_16]
MKKFFSDSISDFILIIILLIISFLTRPLNIKDAFGIGLIIPSLIIWIIARIQLGNSFSLLPKTHNLIANGIYSKIRHPIYVCSTIATIGLVLCFDYWWTFIILILFIFVQFYRAHKEDVLLKKKFEKQWENYKEKTWF